MGGAAEWPHGVLCVSRSQYSPAQARLLSLTTLLRGQPNLAPALGPPAAGLCVQVCIHAYLQVCACVLPLLAVHTYTRTHLQLAGLSPSTAGRDPSPRGTSWNSSLNPVRVVAWQACQVRLPSRQVSERDTCEEVVGVKPQ